MSDSKDTKPDDKDESFLWNPRTKEFLGRTGTSWAKLIIFYIIFYACLAAFWAIMLVIFYQTIDSRAPKWKLSESRIGTNPGLGFRPRPPKDKVDSTLIWFTTGEQHGNYQHWKDDLASFIAPYEKALSESIGEHAASSSECRDSKKIPKEGTFCIFDLNEALQNSTCSKNDNFGYAIGAPCVIIKLNRIYGWKPESFSKDKIPNELDTFFERQGYRFNANDLDNIFITCEGENPADKEALGPIKMSDNGRIRYNYFPYTNQPGYLSPFVFVKFTQPTRATLINIECKAWAANIRHDRMDREGSVHFELLVD